MITSANTLAELCALILLVGAVPASAQQVYKCREVGSGRITFSDQPCPKTQQGSTIDASPSSDFGGSYALPAPELTDSSQERNSRRKRVGVIGDARSRATGPESELCKEMSRPMPGTGGRLTAAQRDSMVAACTEGAPRAPSNPELCEKMKRTVGGSTGYTAAQRRSILAACAGVIMPPAERRPEDQPEYQEESREPFRSEDPEEPRKRSPSPFFAPDGHFYQKEGDVYRNLDTNKIVPFVHGAPE